MRTRRIALIAALATVASLLSISAATPAGADTPHYRVHATKVAPGLTLVTLVDPRTPEHIFVLKMNPRMALSLDVGLASRSAGGFERTSGMAARAGAVAAINGDFAYWSGRPMHTFMQNGFLRYTTHRHGQNFALSEDETAHFMDEPKAVATMTVRSKRTPVRISHVNDGDPVGAQFVEWTPAFTDHASADACTARLRGDGRGVWGPGKRKVVHPYRVVGVTCGSKEVRLQNRVAISAKRYTRAAALLRSLHPGSPVKLTASMGWPDVTDSIGGIPQLVGNGRITLTGCDDPDFCGRNPRTGIGVTANGTVLLVIVDGRRERWSLGMGLREFAQLFKYLGAVQAMNLDGGGSATMVVKGRIVNKPSDSTGERPVTCSVLVLPRSDRGQTTLTSAPPAIEVTPESAATAERAAASDPGSLGGLLHAMEDGLFR